MKSNRREFLSTLSAMAALGFLPRIGRAAWLAPELNFAHKELRGGAVAIGSLTTGGNVLVLPSAEGPIMVDAKFAHTAPALMADVQALVHAKPAMLINTHHHGDHTGGNWIFSEGATIAAHKNFNPRIPKNLAQYAQQVDGYVKELRSSNADEGKVKAAADIAERVKAMKAQQFQATKDLEDGPSVIEFGGVTAQCYHYGNGHTDNDLVIYFPKQNILHMGDLLFNNVWPYIDRSAKADTRSWQKSVQQAMKLGDEKTIVIPGHGEITDKLALPKQIEFFDKAREIVAGVIKEGKSKDEVQAMKPSEFKEYGFDQIRPVTLGGIYEELTEKKD